MADPNAIDAGSQVVVLAFDLLDSEIGHLPGQLERALMSPQVQQAIQKSLLDFAQTHQGTAGTSVSQADAQKLVEALGKGVQDAATTALLDQIKKTSAYQKLEASIQAFQKAAASTSLGVWVDEHKGIVYVIGAALVLGAGSVLYITKSGGAVVNIAMDPLRGKQFDIVTVGSLTIKAGLWDFRPDARVVGARVEAIQKWKQLSLDVKFGILAKGPDIQQVEGSAMLKSGNFSLGLTGDGKPQEHTFNLGLKFGLEGTAGNGKFNLGIGAVYQQNNTVSGTLSAGYQTKAATIGLQGNVGPKPGGGAQYGGLLTLTIPL